ncbi:hypothetical protein SK128_000230 [Halocaridina rubra]|uniref:Trans-Golgi network integral membrane protein 2 n=1 Tax=Halocaridina rubra TaxID=373956 RepID=A0AAN9ADY1_HALRR
MKKNWLSILISSFMVTSVALSSPVSKDAVVTDDATRSENSQALIKNTQESNIVNKLIDSTSKTSDSSVADRVMAPEAASSQPGDIASLDAVNEGTKGVSDKNLPVEQKLYLSKSTVANQNPLTQNENPEGSAANQSSTSGSITSVEQNISQKQNGDDGSGTSVVADIKTSARVDDQENPDNADKAKQNEKTEIDKGEDPQQIDSQAEKGSEKVSIPATSENVAISANGINDTASDKIEEASEDEIEQESDGSLQKVNEEEKENSPNVAETMKVDSNQEQGDKKGSNDTSVDSPGEEKTPEAVSKLSVEAEAGASIPPKEKAKTTSPPAIIENGDDFSINEYVSQDSPKTAFQQNADNVSSYDKDDDEYGYDISKSSMQGGIPYAGPSFNDVNSEDDPARAEDKDNRYPDFGTDDEGDINGADANQAEQKMAGHFANDEDSHFFAYFLTIMVTAIIFYLVFHNKQRIIALIIEGRAPRNGRSRRMSGRAKYHKLDNNLEEAITATKGSKYDRIY